MAIITSNLTRDPGKRTVKTDYLHPTYSHLSNVTSTDVDWSGYKLYHQEKYVTPGYGASSGPYEPLPYRVVSETIQYSNGTWVSSWTPPEPATSGYRTTRSGSFVDTTFGFSAEHQTTDFQLAGIIAELRTEVETLLLEKIKDERTNIANMFAERRQAMDQVFDAAKRITMTLVRLKRGDWSGAAAEVLLNPAGRKRGRFKKDYAKNQAKAIADAWIGFQYGWKPLVEGVRSAVQVLTEGKRPLELTSKVTRSKQLTLLGSTYHSWGTVKQKTVGTVTMTGRITYGVAGDITKLSQIGATNPLSPLWELTPWSFVVDWFLPVGRAISNLDATNGMSFRRGSISVKVELESVGSYHHTIVNGDGLDVWDLNAFANKREFSRSVLKDFPSVSLPRFKNPVSWAHTLNTLALVVQRIK